MKRDFNAWLKSLGDSAPVKTLTELRLWNLAHTQAGALKYGQSNLDISDEMDLERDKARYEADRAKDIRLAGTNGIDAAMATHKLDALLFAAGSGASIAARPGYPTVIVPFGQVPNAPDAEVPGGFDAKASPYGVAFTGMACSEPRLIALAYAFEQATKRRVAAEARVGTRGQAQPIARNPRNFVIRNLPICQSAMEDLTTGSLSRHLMKTASFMLVTMVFQTLYFLVDLYWVGRLGKEAVAAVAIAGNLMFVVLAVTQMLGRGDDRHGVPRGGPQGPRHGAARLQPVAGAVGRWSAALLRAGDGGCAACTRERWLPMRRRRRWPCDYLTWFIPAMSMQFALVAMGAALRGTGNFKPGMVVQTATVIINIVLAPVLMFGWGSGRPLGVAGAAIASLIAVDDRRRLDVAATFLKADAFLRFDARRRARPTSPLWKRMLGDRAARRRGVRADGGVPADRLRDQPAVRRRRRRPASASASASSRRCSCRSWRWGLPWRRWRARTSAPARATACSRPSATAR